MDHSNKNTSPVFHAPAGAITGWYDDGVIRATGIRYARSQRFQAPVPEPPSPTPIMATQRTGCPQVSVAFIEKLFGETASPHFIVDESAQYLSITLPANIKKETPLPVMVWIHGGSYHIGSCDLQTSNPKLLVQEQQVIVVSVNYRLGLFGFLGGYDHRPANLGLLDLREALRWIKKNISAFGGNPDCITLLGQSAGGDAALHLMIAEDTKDLFKRVIIQSAPLGITRGREKMSQEFSSNTTHITSETPINQIISDSLSKAPSILKHGLKAGMPMGLQYGHAPLPPEDKIDEAFRKIATKYDMLIGSTSNETALFTQVNPTLQRITKNPIIKMLLMNPVVRYSTKRIYARAAKRFANNFAKAGGVAYVYKLNWGTKILPLGAAHCVDLALLFGGEVWQKAPLIQNMPLEGFNKAGKQLRTMWAQFARTGTLLQENMVDTDVLTYRKIAG